MPALHNATDTRDLDDDVTAGPLAETLGDWGFTVDRGFSSQATTTDGAAASARKGRREAAEMADNSGFWEGLAADPDYAAEVAAAAAERAGLSFAELRILLEDTSSKLSRHGSPEAADAFRATRKARQLEAAAAEGDLLMAVIRLLAGRDGHQKAVENEDRHAVRSAAIAAERDLEKAVEAGNRLDVIRGARPALWMMRKRDDRFRRQITAAAAAVRADARIRVGDDGNYVVVSCGWRLVITPRGVIVAAGRAAARKGGSRKANR